MKALIQELNLWQSRGKNIFFWWRSDDIATITPRFETLLKIQQKAQAPIALATIPKLLDQSCRELLSKLPGISILQHGYSHQNYSNSLKERVELGGNRLLYDILVELEEGKEILKQQFLSQFLPIMVPPWHNIHPMVAQCLPDVGLTGVSLKEFQHLLLPKNFQRLNVHIDLVEWHPHAHFKGRETLVQEHLTYLKKGWHSEQAMVLGLLTHHEFHDDQTFDFLKELLQLINEHPACRWITADEYSSSLISTSNPT